MDDVWVKPSGELLIVYCNGDSDREAFDAKLEFEMLNSFEKITSFLQKVEFYKLFKARSA